MDPNYPELLIELADPAPSSKRKATRVELYLSPDYIEKLKKLLPHLSSDRWPVPGDRLVALAIIAERHRLREMRRYREAHGLEPSKTAANSE